MAPSLIQGVPPLLPTTVVGSYATPSWLWTAWDEIEKGNYGTTDVNETLNDAVNIAIWDQEKAGVDIITDGEMRRQFFIMSFYSRFTGVEPLPPLRKIGYLGYDSLGRFKLVGRIAAPQGLGVIEEFKYLKDNTVRPVKVTCPGPLTMGYSIEMEGNRVFKDRMELNWDLSKIINTELKALVEAGAEFIQVDEPDYAIIPGGIEDWVSLFNATVEGVNSKIALHICFGNFASRPLGKRTYRWVFPAILDAKADQLVLEFANREMKEIEMWKELGVEKELGAGLVDVKSFYVETPEDVAERIRLALKYVPVEKLYINPDCGFAKLPRWLSFLKLKNMVEGTRIVRRELEG
ncbi:MAG: methionine synthase [Dehalococcoidia bacterium]